MSTVHTYPTKTYIDPSSVVDGGAEIGKGTTIWHFCHIMSGAHVGHECHIGQNVVVQSGVRIGDRCRILNNVTLYQGVRCEDEVFLGPSCVFTNVINPRAFLSKKDELRNTLVGRGATIGANATILCGISVGAYAMIGAGSVVTRSVPSFALVVGNPARQIGWVSREGHSLSFVDGVAICHEEGGQRYALSEDHEVSLL